MSTLVLRSVKGAALTSTEIDTNFDNLNIGKVESATPVFSGLVTLPSQSIALTESNLPDIAPSLNLDFANSKQLDSRITFGRGSGGAYYDGKTTAMAEQNLLTYSQVIGGGNWALIGGTASVNSAVAPDGTTTASTLTSTSGDCYIVQNLSMISGLTYTFSLWMSAASATTIRFGIGNTIIAAVSVTTSWQRFTITVPYSGANRVIIGGVFSFPSTSPAIYAWGAQLEQRSSVTAYTPTTTAPITNYIPVLLQAPLNTPRFDHDSRPTFNGTCTVSGSSVTLPTTFSDGSSPSTINKFYTGSINISGTAYVINNYVGSTRVVTVTGSPTAGAFSLVNNNYGQSLGLLIEEARENKLTYSSDFSNDAWNKANVTITSAANVAPDGTQTTQNIIPSKVVGGANYPVLYQPFSATSGVTYIISAYVKYNGVRYIAFRTHGTNFVWFDVLSGTIANNSDPSLFKPFVTSVGNGWYRVGCSVLAITTGSMNHHVYLTDNSASVSWSGAANGYSGIYIWGAQLEAGSFATSYIPTPSSSTVTRLADAVSMTGTNFSSWYNQAQGGFCSYTDFLYPAVASFYSVGGITTFALSSTIHVGKLNTYDAQRSTVTVYANTLTSSAMSYINSWTDPKIGNLNLAVNGIFDIGDSTALTYLLFNATALTLGSGVGYYLNGHIRKLTYYPKALSSTQLQGLTK